MADNQRIKSKRGTRGGIFFEFDITDAIADIVEIINAKKGIVSANFKFGNVDSNNNGRVDDEDINAIINTIMNKK